MLDKKIEEHIESSWKVNFQTSHVIKYRKLNFGTTDYFKLL